MILKDIWDISIRVLTSASNAEIYLQPTLCYPVRFTSNIRAIHPSNEAIECLLTPKRSLKHRSGLIFHIKNIHQEVNCVSLAAFITPNISKLNLQRA